MEGDQAIGRSRGVATTRIHAVAEGAGRLVHFLLNGGNVNDCTQGAKLLETVPADNVVGDEAYDTNDIIETIEGNGGNAVIPSKSNRKVASSTSPATKMLVENLTAEISRLAGQIEVMKAELVKLFPKDQTVSLYASLPGIGLYIAVILKLVLGDCSRFHSEAAVIAYCGLGPVAE